MSIPFKSAKARAVLSDERRRSLSVLTREDAWRIYSDLCDGWEKNPNKQGLDRLEHRRIKHLLELRRKLDRVAGRGRDGNSA